MSLQDNEAGLKISLQKYQTIDTLIQSLETDYLYYFLPIMYSNDRCIFWFDQMLNIFKIKGTRMRIRCQTNTAVVYISLALRLWYYYEHWLHIMYKFMDLADSLPSWRIQRCKRWYHVLVAFLINTTEATDHSHVREPRRIVVHR